MADITAIILTKNEELNIEKCISSIKTLARQIIVVDSFSDDKTIEIARLLGAEVYQNKFIDHATQFNWALDNTNIKSKWVLRIDADERMLSETAKEIKEKTKLHKDDDVNGFILKFRVFFMGKWIKHGGIYPFRKLFLFKYGIGRVEQRRMDEHVILSSGITEEINNDLLHYDYKDLTYWTAKHNWYATKETQDYFEYMMKEIVLNELPDQKTKIKRFLKFHVYYKLPFGVRPFLYFIYRYIIKLGFLDGKEGFIFHFLQAYWYRFLVDAKIYECERNGKVYEETGDLKV